MWSMDWAHSRLFQPLARGRWIPRRGATGKATADVECRDVPIRERSPFHRNRRRTTCPRHRHPLDGSARETGIRRRTGHSSSTQATALRRPTSASTATASSAAYARMMRHLPAGCEWGWRASGAGGFARQTETRVARRVRRADAGPAASAGAACCVKCGIPVRRLTWSWRTRRRRGIVSHAQVSEVFKKSDHTIQDRGFPGYSFWTG
jgi:hypothetical protein